MATKADSGDERPSSLQGLTADMDCDTLSRSFRKMDQKCNLFIQALGFDLQDNDDDTSSVIVDAPKGNNEDGWGGLYVLVAWPFNSQTRGRGGGGGGGG